MGVVGWSNRGTNILAVGSVWVGRSSRLSVDDEYPVGSRDLIRASAANGIGVLPVFMLGGLAPLIRDELGFSESHLGLAASCFYVSAALSTVPGGRTVERYGFELSLIVSTTVTVGSLLAMAGARSFGQVAMAMILAGVANGIVLPATNLVVATRISPRRQGLGFGLKQSAGPVATMAAGVALPLSVKSDWRWAFTGLALLCLPMLLGLVPNGARKEVRSDRHTRVRTPLVVIAMAAGIAVAAGGGLTTFYVEFAVDTGMTTEEAGVMLLAGSVAAVVGRILWSWLGGRTASAPLRLVAFVLLVGAVSFLILSSGRSSLLMLTTLSCFAAGWGWQGLFHLTVSRLSGDAVSRASGIVGSGMFAGGVVGPVGFGLLVEANSYAFAWRVAGLALAAAGAVMFGMSRGALFPSGEWT